MQLAIEELETKLAQRGLSKSYFLISTEYFLLQEARSHIWQHANTQGCFERQVWEISLQTNWDDIKKRSRFLDLFDRSLIDLRITEALKGQASNELQKLVQQLIKQSNPPLLVISYEQSIKKAQLHDWFQKVAQVSTLVILQVPVGNQLLKWINKQFKQVKLRLTNESMLVLMQCTEGNLLAIAQLIRKLALIYEPDKPALTLAELQVVLEDQAVFELFQLTEAILQKDLSRCFRILQHLRVRGISQALILGYLLKLLRTAARLRHGLNKGYALNTLFQQHAVWKNQQAGFKKFVQRIQADDIPALFNLAYYADQCIKGAVLEDGWHGLSRLSLCLADQRLGMHLDYYNVNE